MIDHDQTKDGPLVLGVVVGLGVDNPLPLNPVITETRSREKSLYQENTVAGPHNRSDSMMRGGQSQQDASKLKKPLVHPKNIIKIVNWNVCTLYRSGNIAQVAT